MSAAPAGTMYSVLTDGTGAQIAKVTVNYDPSTLALVSVVAENDTAAKLPVVISNAAGAVQTASLPNGTTTYAAKQLSRWGFNTLPDLQGVSISTPS